MHPFGNEIKVEDIALTPTGYLFKRYSKVYPDTIAPWMTDPANWFARAHVNSQPKFTIQDKSTGQVKHFMGWKALADFVGNL